MTVSDYDLYHGAVLNQLVKNGASVKYIENFGRGYLQVNDVLILHIRHATRANNRYSFIFLKDLVKKYGEIIDTQKKKIYVALFCVEDQVTVALSYYELRLLIESVKHNRKNDTASYSVNLIIQKNKKVRVSIGNGDDLDNLNGNTMVSRDDFPNVMLNDTLNAEDINSTETKAYVSQSIDVGEEDSIGKELTGFKEQIPSEAEDELIYEMARKYREGDGVEMDENKALDLLLPLSERGVAKAQYELARAYESSDYADRQELAFKWYERAAEGGSVHAQSVLAQIYQHGDGGPRDYYRAIQWFKAAALQGDEYAMYSVACMYENGDVDYGEDPDYQKAFEWRLKAAENGFGCAQLELAEMYYQGDFVVQSFKEAVKWYDTALMNDYIPFEVDFPSKNYADALLELGNECFEGKDGDGKDVFKAFEYYKKSAELENAEAQYQLGEIYYYGYGTEPDYNTAASWYEKSAINGDSAAQYSLGYMFQSGQGVKLDYRKAVDWYMKAVKNRIDKELESEIKETIIKFYVEGKIDFDVSVLLGWCGSDVTAQDKIRSVKNDKIEINENVIPIDLEKENHFFSRDKKRISFGESASDAFLYLSFVEVSILSNFMPGDFKWRKLKTAKSDDLCIYAKSNGVNLLIAYIHSGTGIETELRFCTVTIETIMNWSSIMASPKTNISSKTEMINPPFNLVRQPAVPSDESNSKLISSINIRASIPDDSNSASVNTINRELEIKTADILADSVSNSKPYKANLDWRVHSVANTKAKNWFNDDRDHVLNISVDHVYQLQQLFPDNAWTYIEDPVIKKISSFSYKKEKRFALKWNSNFNEDHTRFFLCNFLQNITEVHLNAPVLNKYSSGGLPIEAVVSDSLDGFTDFQSCSSMDRFGEEPDVSVGSNTSLNPMGSDNLFAQLDNMTGLESVKTELRTMVNFAKIQRMRKEQNLQGDPVSLHMVFTGNPGTGKTTVARLVGKILYSAGLLQTDTFVECDRSSLVTPYRGQTAINVNEIVDSAIGGILFIDEAYTLYQSDDDKVGKEAIDTILKRMEDDRDKLCVIIAGYTNQIRNFVDSNPGLASRFTRYINFMDYSKPQLVEIMKTMILSNDYRLSSGVEYSLDKLIDQILNVQGEHFGNARAVRTAFEKIRERHAARVAQLFKPSKADLYTITEFDINPKSLSLERPVLEDALKKLHSMIGLSSVKKSVDTLATLVQANQLQESRGMSIYRPSFHMVFTGNPGTGKTTVARLIGDILFSLGILSKGHVVEVSRVDLVGKYIGRTALQTLEAVKSALGGILFIDEAYTLINRDSRDFGFEAVNTLLKEMEDRRDQFVVIVAGYTSEMEKFIESNPGLKSRFTKFIHFDDYGFQELKSIFIKFSSDNGYTISDDGLLSLNASISRLLAHKGDYFGNGRDVRNLFEKTLERQALRIVRHYNEATPVNIIVGADFEGE